MKNFLKISIYLLSALTALTLGCEGILDVKNPNNVLEEDLNNPAAASGIANGALSRLTSAIGDIYSPYTVATDETRWIGSRDAWGQLDNGIISDAYNEFTDAAYPSVNTARWMCDKAVSQLEGFDGAGKLVNRLDLARSYVYQALIRIVIADLFDDFVFSDKTDAKPPFGEANMSQLYDQAVGALDKAEAIVKAPPASTTKTEWLRRILGLRARAKQGKAVWALVHPKPKSSPAPNPYVNVAAAVAEANAALAVMSADWKWELDFNTPITFNDFQWEVVGRLELAYEAIPNDPVTGSADTRMTAERNKFQDKAKWQDRYAPITVLTQREMYLITAEAFLAAGDQANARAELNKVRALNNLAPYAVTHDINTALQHERRANLYLQGRRLTDMYRFGIKDSRWLAGTDALANPGTFLPVTIIERRANPAYPK